jgi:hypothetical protein
VASLATIFRQVEREGARWGLVPVMRDGKVAVCELVSELHSRPGTPVIPHKAPRVVCSLDEKSGLDAFAAVLAHRLRREHHDFMRLVRKRQDRLAAEARREMETRRRDLRAKLETLLIRRRIMSVGR